METNQTLMRRVTYLTTTLKKVFLTRAIVIIACLVSLSSISQAQNIITTLSSRSKCPGDTVWVSIYVQNLVNCSAGSLEFKFDPNVLTPTPLNPPQADAPTIGYRNKNSQITGMWLLNAHTDTVTLGFFNLMSPINIASGLICQLLFTVNNANGYSALTWNLGVDSSSCMYNDFNDPFGPPLPAEWVNGNVHTSPSISAQASNLTLIPGGSGSFSITAVDAISYQWQVSVDGGTIFNDIPAGAPYSGETTNTLTITNATLSMLGYKYRCTVGGNCTPPYNTMYSNVVTLTVSVPCPTPYQVTGGGSYCPGTSGAVVGLADSEINVMYQLKRNGVAVGSPVAGTGDAITFGPQTVVTSPSTFTAEGTNSCGTVQMTGSVTVSTYVLPIGIINPPNPNPTVCAGQGTYFFVQLSGPTGYLPCVVTYKDELNNLYPPVTLTSGNNVVPINPVATHTYTLYSLVDNHGCSATNMSGSATINVNPAPSLTIGSNSPVCQGDNLQFTAFASGSVNYNWTHPATGWSSTSQNPSRPTALPSYAGTYYCQATFISNSCSTTASTEVTINPPLPDAAGIITGPDHVCKGQTGVVYSVGTIANATTYVWSVPSGFNIMSGSGTNSITVNIGTNALSDYIHVAGNNACGTGAESTLMVVAQDIPTVAWNTILPNQCVNNTTFTLTGGNPAGGTYSGLGVTGTNFNASIAGIGIHTLTYTYADAYGCSSSVTNTITVNGQPTVTWNNPLLEQCVSSNFYLLTGGSPANGTYSGTGVSSGIFNASSAGTGTHTLTYTYLDVNGCSASATNTINVHPLPTVTWTNALTQQCVSSTTYTLTGGNPSGGVYSGVGVTGTNFNASVAGVGVKTLTYTYTDGFGCMNSASNTITVNQLPTVTWTNALANQCINNTTYELSGGSPIGGTYSGVGVTGTNFNASIAGSGMKTLTYTYMNASGCTNFATNSILVYTLPVANAGEDQNLNIGQSATLTGSGSGGSGNYSYLWTPAEYFADNTLQNPTTNPLTGTVTFTLVVTDNVSGCQSIGDQVTITVENLPLTLNVTAFPASICAGGLSTLSAGASGGSGPYTYYWVSDPEGFSSDLASPTVTPSVTTTYYVTVSDNFNSQTGSVIVNVTPLPVVQSVGGGDDLCAGEEGTYITLSGSQAGYNYILNKDGVYLTSLVGSGEALSFGPFTGAGVYTIYASIPVMGCITQMAGAATINVYPNPVVFVGSMGEALCDNNNIVPLFLSGSETGVNYHLFQDGLLAGIFAGTGEPLSLGIALFSGTYTCVAYNVSTNCSSVMDMNLNVTIYPSIQVFNVTGGAAFCGSGASAITLEGSEVNVTYTLYLNGTPFDTQAGTGNALTWNDMSAAGIYTVIATHNITHCFAQMNGQGEIIFNPIPVAYAGADFDIPYGTTTQLLGAVVDETPESFGFHWEPAELLTDPNIYNPVSVNLTAPVDFTLVVTNLETGCFSLADMVHVGITGGPLAIEVTGEPSVICAGESATITVNIENGTGVYDVAWTSLPEGFTSNNTTIVVNPLVNTTYLVTVNDGVSTLSDEFTVTVNPLPEIFMVSGGGEACAGTEGFMVNLSSSQAGVQYFIYLDGILQEGSYVGTGDAMQFGLFNTAGTYTVVAISEGCQSAMEGSANIIIHEVPVIAADPANLSLQEGNSGTFNVESLFTTSYQWQVSINGVDFNDLADDAVYSGSNTNQLTITGATLDMDGYYYRCALNNEYCSALSGTALLGVYPYVAEITASLEEYSVCPGELIIPVHVNNMINVASISLTINFDPAVLTYNGFTNINPAVNDPAMMSANAVNGNLVISHFTLSPFSILDGNLVDLMFTYAGGNTALTWNMGAPENNQFTNLDGDVLNSVLVPGSVNQLADAPVITSHPADVTIFTGGNADFHVVVTGADNYQWRVFDGLAWTDLVNDAVYSGVNTPDLLVTGATLAMNAYQYMCVVTEEICNLEVSSNTAVLYVNPLSEEIVTTIGDATACPETQIIVPVTVEQLLNVSAISLTLGYDASVLTFVNQQNINPAFVNPLEIIFNAAPGYWGMSWYNVVPVSIVSGTLVDLVFTYHGGVTDLAWDLGVSGACEYNDPDGNVLSAAFFNGHVDGYLAPTVVAQPADVTIYDGDNASFTVNATDAIGYSWYVSEDNGTLWTAITDGGIYSGASSPTLQITGSNISMNGNLYHCVISSAMCEITSDEAELTVLPVVQGINTTAGTVYACANTQVIVPVYAEYLYNVSAISLVLSYDPAVLTYTGYQNINPVFNPPYDGIILNSYPGNWALSWYNVSPINLSAGNLIELIFDYHGGSTNLTWDLVNQGYCEYDDADANILPASFFNGFVGPAGDNPVITQQPDDVNISDLGDASFTVAATGAATYQWQESTDNGLTWNNITDGGVYAGATTNALLLSVVPITMDEYLYRCEISGGNCVVYSDNALLNVVPLGGIIETFVPNLVACPGTQIVVPISCQYLYDIAALSLTLTYDDNVLTFVESQNTNALLLNGTLNEFQFDSQWRLSWFSITPVSIGTGNITELVFTYNGGYTDLIWDIATSGNCEYNDFDGNVLLANFTNGSVGPNGIIPSITSSPVDMTVPHHGNAAFTMSATDATAYQWQVSTNGGTDWSDLADNTIYSGVTTPELAITNAIYLYNGYLYRCMVTGEICSIPSDAAMLTVTPIDFILVTTAVSSAECPGTDIVVPVTVNDFYNVASISLALNYDASVLEYIDYQNVNPALTGALLNPGTGLFMLSWYSVTPLSLGDATLFELVFHYTGGTGNMNWDLATQGYCEYTNIDGDVMAASFVDGAVTSAEIIPVILSNPVETGGFVGDPASFTAAADNYVSLQWQVSVDGGITWTDVIDDANITGANTETLSIAHLELEMNGYLYRLKALGTCGHMPVSEAALLTVILQPTIVTTAGTVEQCAGDVVVPITATNIMNVATMNLTLNYDNTLFTYVGYQNVNPVFGTGVITFTNAGNQVITNFSTPVPATTGDGTLFELIFNSTAGTTNLSWDVATAGACEYRTIQNYVIPSAFVDGNILIHPTPVVSIDAVAPQCLDADAVVLTGNPAGGTFSGNGIADGTFDPGIAGVGTHTITYNYVDEFGCGNSTSIDIIVNEMPTYTWELSATEICPGETVTFTNHFTGTAPWTVDATKNGVPEPYTVPTPFELYSEVYNETTVYNMISVTDGNGCTTPINQIVTILVHPVTTILTQPANIAMDEGTSTTFHIVAENALTYQWQLSTDNGTTWVDLVEGAEYTGVNTADLTVAMVDYFMSGNQYRCIVGGYCPLTTTSEPATLTVYPVIITIAGTVEQCAGEVIVPISVIHMYGMAAMSLTLNYDDNVLAYTGYQDVNSELSSGFLAIDATNSQVKMGYFSITPANVGDGLLFNILFQSNGGYSDLTWDTQTLGNCEYQNLDGNLITSLYVNGSVTVNPLPTVTIEAVPPAICLGQSATLTYNFTGTAPWSVEITATSATGVTVTTETVTSSPYIVTITPSETTSYTVTNLVDANDCVAAEGLPVTVTVNELPNADLSVDDNVICAGDDITLTVNFTAGIPPYSVIISNEGVYETYVSNIATLDIPYTPMGNPAVYSIVSITDGNNCYFEPGVTVSVIVNPLPLVTLDPAGPVCLDADPLVLVGLPAGGEYTGDGVVGNTFDPLLTGPGAWNVTYTYTNENNCVNSASQTIVVNGLPAVYSVLGGGQYCAGGAGVVVGLSGSEIGIQYQLFNNGVFTGQSILGDGSVIYFGPQIPGGTYTVLAVDLTTLCDTWMDGNAVVVVNPLPNVYAGGYSIICQGTSTTINAVVTGGAEPYNFQWTPATGLDNPTILNPVASPAGTTYYTILVTDMNGCTDTDHALIIVNQKPVVNAGVDKTIVVGGSVTMTASVSGGLPPYAYSWTPAVGLNDPTVLNPVASPVVTTTYTLQVTDSRGCISTDEVVINVTTVPLGYDITGFVTYDNDFSTPLNNTTVTLTTGGNVINTTLTTGTGEYVFTPMANGTYTTTGSSTKPWGGGNSLDALLMARHFVNLQPLSGLRLQAGDCDGNGIVNAADGLLVMMRSVLMINSFPAGDWIFETKTVDVNNASVTNNFMGICYGDVNGSFIPAAKLGTGVLLDIEGTQAIVTNEDFALPIQAGRNMNLGAISLVLNIPAGLEVTGITPSDLMKSSNFIYNIVDGKLFIEWFTLNNFDVKTGETLFTMTVRTNNFADTKEFVFNVEAQSVMGDQDARIIENALITIPKVRILEAAFSLDNNYPNPFSQSTEISYTIPETAMVTLVIYNAIGDVVATVVNEEQNAGRYILNFDGSNLTQGVYFCRILVSGINKNYEAVNRMIISR